MKIYKVSENDFPALHQMIAKTCKTSLKNYYPEKTINKVIESLCEERLKARASSAHFYVVKDEGKIIGCGAISPYYDSLTESILLSIFVDPDYQGKGVGRKIMETLENDEYALRATRIEIPAGLVAIPFYKKFGYEHKNGELHYKDGHFEMEKFTKIYRGSK